MLARALPVTARSSRKRKCRLETQPRKETGEYRLDRYCCRADKNRAITGVQARSRPVLDPVGASTGRLRFGQAAPQFLESQRPADQIPLHLVAAMAREQFDLLRRLHALGHDTDAKVARQRDDGPQYGRAIRSLLVRRDERWSNLELADRQPMQIVKT